jgi:hypothetical protein
MRDGVTWVPFRAVAEATGAEVGWDGETRAVTSKYNANQTDFVIDGKKAVIVNDITFVPDDFIMGMIEQYHSPIDFTGITISDDEIIYRNDELGFSLAFPASWEGKYNIVENLSLLRGSSVEIFHKPTVDELGEAPGLLFTFLRFDGVFTDPDMLIQAGGTLILANANDYCYFLNGVSDVEYNQTPGSVSAVEYKAMLSQYRDIASSFKLLNEQPNELIDENDDSANGFNYKNVLYTNDKLGFSVELPDCIGDIFGIDEKYVERDERGGAGITIYHKASRDAGDSGDVFYIERWIGIWSQENPPIMAGLHEVVAESDTYTYMISTPSGVEYNGNDKETAEICEWLYTQLDVIGKTVILVNPATSIPNAGYQTEAEFLSDNMQFRETAYEAAEAVLRADAKKLSIHLIDTKQSSKIIQGLTDVYDELVSLQLKFVLSDIISDNEIRASYEYKLIGEDSYNYVSMVFKKQGGEWKVDWIGIEK